MLVLEDGADGLFHPMAEMGHLEHFGEHRHQHADKRQQRQRRNTPDDTVDCIVHIGDGSEQIIHDDTSLIFVTGQKKRGMEKPFRETFVAFPSFCLRDLTTRPCSHCTFGTAGNGGFSGMSSAYSRFT